MSGKGVKKYYDLSEHGKRLLISQVHFAFREFVFNYFKEAGLRERGLDVDFVFECCGAYCVFVLGEKKNLGKTLFLKNRV